MSVAVPNQQLPHVYCEEGAQTRALALASDQQFTEGPMFTMLMTWDETADHGSYCSGEILGSLMNHDGYGENQEVSGCLENEDL